MITVGVIGYGYWGPNIVRNFLGTDGCTISLIADQRENRRNLIQKIYPQIKVTANADDIINDPTIDAVIVATPVWTHYELGKKVLQAGKSLLLEKPMTSSVAEADELINLAAAKRVTLMVDHTFLYTGAVRKMKELISNGTIGIAQYFDSTRINLGLFQPDVNVLWDLAPHDLSILSYLFENGPISVNATGISHTRNGIENIAYMTLKYQADFIAHFHCSWTSPVKVRQTLIGGDQKMILYNDLEPTEKVKIYNTGYTYKTDDDKTRIMVDYRTGDIFIPKVDMKEALSGVAQDFIQSIEQASQPVSHALIGRTVVSILEASQQSIKSNGKEIRI